MAARELLPDDVWAQLRPADARLTRLSSGRLRFLLGAAVVLLATGVALVEVSGILMPRLTASSSSGTAESTTRMITQTVELRNDGWFTEHIDRIDTNAPGLRVTGQKGDLVIGPGRRAMLEVTYQVTDCAAIRRDQPASVLLRFRRPWGHHTTALEASATSTELAWAVCHGPA